MSEDREYTDEDVRDMDRKEFRKEFPSGWMELARVETLVLLIDVLLEAPPTREFTANELAERAGLNRRSVESHVDSLVELGVVEKLEQGRDTPRYAVNERSPVKRRLDDLNVAVQRVREGDDPESVPRSDESVSKSGSDESVSKSDSDDVAERRGNDVVRSNGDDDSSVRPGPASF